LDAEYHQKENIKRDSILTKKGYSRIGEFAYVTDGIHTSIDYCDNSNIRLFSATTPRENYFDLSRDVYISKKAHEANPRTALKEDDIIISTVGTIGNCAVVNKSVLPANSDRHVGIIRIKNDEFLPRFISTFLLTRYGRFQTLRESTGNVQLNLFLYKIRELKIPNLSHKFQSKIEELIVACDTKIGNSNDKYSQAENLLMTELGLENFNPSNGKISIKSLKESFLKTGRLDSEYYQPKYEIVEEKLNEIGVEKLENICSLINYGTVPTSPYVKNSNSVPYIKGMNLKNCFVDGELDEIENVENLQDKFFTKENDIIISQMGTVGDVGIVTKEQENYLFASFTIRARLNDDRFNPYFVGAYIQNVAKEYYLYRNIALASVRQNTDLPTIKNMPIPLVKKDIQDEIASYIWQSMEYSKKAKELLKISTKAVEIAIEKDEEMARNLLDRQTDRQTDIQTLVTYYKEQAIYYNRLSIFRLYEEIGLFNELKSVNYTVKNLKDTFAISGRLDSEYYQEKYDRLFKRIERFDCKKLKDIAVISRGALISDTLYDTGNINYIRGNNITSFTVDDECVKVDVNIGEYRSIEKGNIVFAIVGSVGQVALYNKNDKAIVSNNLGVIKLKKSLIDANYLTLALNTIVGKLQFEKFQTRTAQPKISIDDVKNIIIPIIEKEKQEKISRLLIESESLRNESKFILDKAVRAVEIAIEDGEDKANFFLQSNFNSPE